MKSLCARFTLFGGRYNSVISPLRRAPNHDRIASVKGSSASDKITAVTRVTTTPNANIGSGIRDYLKPQDFSDVF